MTPDLNNLQRLSGDQPRTSTTGSIPVPRRRWLLRGGVPLAIVTTAALLLAWSLRDVLVRPPEVTVVPVIPLGARGATEAATSTSDRASPSEPVIVAQAPGWIEPEPFAVTVQSMVPGVVERVLVLEGQRVSIGDELVHLIRIDAELELARAHAELAALEADVARANASVATATARAAEVDEELVRLRPLAEAGGAPTSQIARLESRRRTHDHEIALERAMVDHTQAAVAIQRIAVREAELALDRKVVRAPVDGVVLARSVVPGTRIAFAGDGPGEAHEPGLLTIYDPAQLQVRADVTLGDAGKIGLGTRARITSEAMPDRIFDGEVIRVLHKADLQRNTVQAKVRLVDPTPQLKPEMLVRVRFLGSSESPVEATPRVADATTGGGQRFLIPRAAIRERDDRNASVLVAVPGERRGLAILRRTAVMIESTNGDDVVAVGPLRVGDRVVTDAAANLLPDLAGGRVVRPREKTPSTFAGEGR